MGLSELTLGQYQTVYNALSFVIASFLGALTYFILTRNEVSPKYRSAATIASVIMVIAGYHYFRIMNSWTEAFKPENNLYHPTGLYFNSSYRYIDWLLTVPLLAAELAIVTCSDRARSVSSLAKYTIAAGLMIVLGLVGELSTDSTQRTIWAVLSTIPFIYLLVSLWIEIGKNLPNIPESARRSASNLRYLLVATWGVYPIVYMFPDLKLTSANWFVAGQVGFCTADVFAKALFSLIIHWIAVARSRAEGFKAA